MGADKLSSFLSRVFFLAAFLLLAIAVLERLVSFVGYTILGSAYTAGRMLEFAAVMLLFVIALLLRQVRESSQRKAP